MAVNLNYLRISFALGNLLLIINHRNYILVMRVMTLIRKGTGMVDDQIKALAIVARNMKVKLVMLI